MGVGRGRGGPPAAVPSRSGLPRWCQQALALGSADHAPGLPGVCEESHSTGETAAAWRRGVLRSLNPDHLTPEGPTCSSLWSLNSGPAPGPWGCRSVGLHTGHCAAVSATPRQPGRALGEAFWKSLRLSRIQSRDGWGEGTGEESALLGGWQGMGLEAGDSRGHSRDRPRRRRGWLVGQGPGRWKGGLQALGASWAWTCPSGMCIAQGAGDIVSAGCGFKREGEERLQGTG